MPLRFVGAPTELRHLNIRKEGPEDGKELAVDLKLQVILDALYLEDFDPLLEHTLFTLRDGNWAVQFPQMGPIHWSGEMQHMALRFGQIDITDAKVHRFEIEPRVNGAGKFITLRCSVSFKPNSGRKLALLAELVGETALLDMEPPRDLLTQETADDSLADGFLARRTEWVSRSRMSVPTTRSHPSQARAAEEERGGAVVKERPILFSAPMVRALLAGTKTQTRRAIKVPSVAPWTQHEDGYWSGAGTGLIRCPYGQPGDRLWVRETWCDDWKESRGIVYRADGDLVAEMFDAGCTWRPSIHMPRELSRITLEITDVRVERLQEISEADAKAEGVYPPPAGTDDDGAHFDAGSYRDGFRSIWESIHGPGAWDANPWVWVLEFRPL